MSNNSNYGRSFVFMVPIELADGTPVFGAKSADATNGSVRSLYHATLNDNSIIEQKLIFNKYFIF